MPEDPAAIRRVTQRRRRRSRRSPDAAAAVFGGGVALPPLAVSSSGVEAAGGAFAPAAMAAAGAAPADDACCFGCVGLEARARLSWACRPLNVFDLLVTACETRAGGLHLARDGYSRHRDARTSSHDAP